MAFLAIQNSFYVEVMGEIIAIKHVKKVGFIILWLKTDPSLLCQAFISGGLISWPIRWIKWLKVCEIIYFKVNYIFKEGNECVDKLTNLKLDNKLDFAWYDTLSTCITLDFFS